MFKKIILSIATIAATASLAVSVQASEKVELKVATDSDTAPFTYQKTGNSKVMMLMLSKLFLKVVSTK